MIAVEVLRAILHTHHRNTHTRTHQNHRSRTKRTKEAKEEEKEEEEEEKEEEVKSTSILNWFVSPPDETVDKHWMKNQKCKDGQLQVLYNIGST